jgi:signal transduction histidine kinase
VLRAGEPLIVGDALVEMPDTAPLTALGARATVCIPLVRDGRLDALLAVHDAAPRRWSPAEILVIRQAAMRSWALVERVRAEAALRDLNATLEARVAERAAAVRQGEQTIRTVFENSFMDQTLLSTTGEVLYVNATALGGIEAAADAVVGRPFAETPWFAATPGAPAQVRGGIIRAAGGENVRLHLSLDLPTGPRVYDYSLRPAFDGAGEVVAIVSEAIEITARVRAEDALRQAQKMEAVGQLTGGLAHDFNNLLAAISGNLELLERRLSEGQVHGLARYIDGATQGARRAAALTQRLLAFSRRQTLDPRPTDADRLIADMTDLIRQSVGPAVAVEIAATEGLWPINVDASQLENALLNLCVNARDAMAPDGGRLAIRTDNVVLGDGDVLRRDVVAGDYVRISVIDSGAGMPPAVIQRAFDPFFTTKPIGQGTGLGLSMVYGFARQSGGQVRIESVEGQGTTICLCLPRFHGTAEIAAAAAAAAGPAMPPEQGAGETVLVIDDEPVLRALIVEVLEEAGYRVLSAGDGARGLRLLDSGARIDLLVTDVGLPGGMNGRQVADAARLSRPTLRVLFITGYAEVAAVGQPGAWGGLEPGMGVLTKPFPVGGLIAKIREMLD